MNSFSFVPNIIGDELLVWLGPAALGEYTVYLFLIIKLVGWNIFLFYFFNSYGRSEVPRISARTGCPATLMPCTPRIIILIWLKNSHGKIIKKNSRNVFRVKATFLNFTWQVNTASCPSKNSFAFAINKITAKVKQKILKNI